MALLLAAAPVAAQPSFGVTAGLNVATVDFSIDGTAVENLAPRLGLVAGAFAELPLTPSLSVRPELLYSQTGFTQTTDGADLGGSSLTLGTEFDYLHVPVLLRYRLPLGPNGLVAGVEAGPALSYLVRSGISCRSDLAGLCALFDDPDGESDANVDDLDVGLALGATLGAGPFGVGVRYTHGLTNYFDDDEDRGGPLFDIRALNRVFSVTARYTLGG